MRKSVIVVFAIFCIIVCSVGYAQLSDSLTISGTASAEPLGFDVYIDDVTPSSSAGVNVLSYSSTVLMMRVVDYGIATFTVTVINQSDKTYVFERVIDGAELSIDGVYDGDDITYSLSGLVSLQELAPSAHHTFDISISVPNGVTADSYILKINYMIKSDTGILPGEPDPEPDPDPDPEPDPDPDPEPDPDPDPEPDPDDPSIDDVVNENFAGLVDALLSDSTDCLNDPGSNVIFNAVQETLTNKKRGDDAPILHCLVNSISGGTMTGITDDVNQGLTENLHFVFEADPTDTNRLYLYMYYEDQCTDENVGNRILVYKQVVSRNSEGLWHEDGTYLGSAVVGYYFGGGNGNNDVLTVDVYSWVFGELQAA